MIEDPSSTSPTSRASCIALSEIDIKSYSNHTMVCTGTQRKLLSSSNATENLNPNVNQGSCKRKIKSSTKTNSTSQCDASSNAPKHHEGQACVDFILISPSRKHLCGSTRCASKARRTHECCLQANKEGDNPHTCSINPCTCLCSHDSQLRRWSSDDKDCKPFAEDRVPSPFSDPSKHVMEGTALCHFETAHQKNVDDLLSLREGYGAIDPENIFSEVKKNRSEEHNWNPTTGSTAEVEEGAVVSLSRSLEKRGNWRLNAVLSTFNGDLSPTREGRVKTLVQAFESLLSVKDNGDQQARGTKPRNFPLQFSYLSSNRKESLNERGNEDISRTGNEGEEVTTVKEWQDHETAYALAEEVEDTESGAIHEHARQDTQHIYNQQKPSTDGGVGDCKDAGGDGTLLLSTEGQAQRSQVVVEEKAENGLGGEGDDSLSTRVTLRNQHASHSQVLKEEESKGHERRQSRKNQVCKLPTVYGVGSHQSQELLTMPQRKPNANQKPHTDSRRYSLQRFSIDGHSSNSGARKKECNKSHKPSPGSNPTISSSRPPLVQKTQIQKAQEKPQASEPQPFKLLTQERGLIKEQEFLERLKKLIEEEEKLRVPLAQGLPWTTDEPAIPHKPPVKENTKPLDVHLNSDLRAMERAEFDRFIAERLLHIEEQRMEKERLRRIAEEEEVKRMRQEMVPKAQLMPYFDRPFVPRRSSKRPTIPKEPQFQLNSNSKQPKRQKCVSSSIC